MKTINIKTITRNSRLYFEPGLARSGAAKYARQIFGEANKILLVTDKHVYSIYQDTINDFLSQSGFEHRVFKVEKGEQEKNLENTELIYREMVDFNMHRNDIVVAFGGGVIGDLSGFAASTYHRGVKFLQFPTTIIGQVDSSIGGKVAVNFSGIKNIIGSFYQPHAIFIDTDLLQTLEEIEIINGLAEVIKYGIIFKKDILKTLESISRVQNAQKDPRKLILTSQFQDIIFTSCRIKSKVITIDEFESGYRSLLNFGHTFAHAIEKTSKLKYVSHGIAVAIGMVLAVEVSILLGYAKEPLKEELIRLYELLKMPGRLKNPDINGIIDSMKYDKKFSSKETKLILVKDLNKPVFAYNIDEEILRKAIEKNILEE